MEFTFPKDFLWGAATSSHQVEGNNTNNDWWDNIPKGAYVALQGNNMKHDDHVVHSSSLNAFCKMYPLGKILYKGELDFTYPDWNFTRYMQIGIK